METPFDLLDDVAILRYAHLHSIIEEDIEETRVNVEEHLQKEINVDEAIANFIHSTRNRNSMLRLYK